MPDTGVQPYLEHIAQYEREFKKWEQRVDKILDRYRDEKRGSNAGARFNVLWSNVQTLVPAVYSRTPKVDVSRRYTDNDPVGRVAALILERGLSYEIDHYPDFRQSMRACVYDRFLGGRGSAWVRYEPHIAAVAGTPEDGAQVTDVIDETYEVLENECVPVDYVHWRDFGHQVARTWPEVNVLWRRVYMTRDACVERFGPELGEKIPLDSKPQKDRNKSETDSDALALVYEIWDKEKRRALWLSKSLGKFVDERDDPLHLEEFFPCPRPLYATLTSDTLVPVPDFIIYQDQAAELDVLADRMEGLIQALQVKGVYNAEFPVLARLFTEGDNGKLLPVKDFAAFAEKNGMKGAIDLVDLEPIYEALLAAYKACDQIKQQIYDLTGLADIVRGSSAASETATAQQIKGQYASMRLNNMKMDVAHFATDILRLKAQLMSKFQPDTLTRIAGVKELSPEDQQIAPQALQLLASGDQRGFRIEVNADSLVQMDEQQERQDRTALVAAVGGALKEAGPIVAQAPELAPMMLELIKFAASAYKAGKTIEGTIDAALDQMKQVVKQKQSQPPPPNPEVLKLQAEKEAADADRAADAQRVQAELAADQQRAAMELQFEGQRLQLEQAAEAQRLQFEAALEAQRVDAEAAREQFRAMQEEQFQRWKELLTSETKIEVAEIAAGAVLDAAQASAAEAATQTTAQE